MISLDQSRALVAHVASLHGCTVLTPDSPVAEIASTLIAGVSDLVPVVHTLVEAMGALLGGSSHTLPIPGTSPCRSVVMLSRDAVATPAGYAETGCHECQHGAQGQAVGSGQVLVDYIMSAELRGLREAHAYSVGMFVRHVVDGTPYSVDAAIASLSSPLYALGADDLELARHILDGHALLVDRKRPPPLSVAVEALKWLRANAADAIVAEGWRS